MNHLMLMNRGKLLDVINDCLETSYDFRVTRSKSKHWDTLFKLEVRLGDDTWVPIVPTSTKPEPAPEPVPEPEATPPGYSVVYGHDGPRGYYANFCAHGANHQSEISDLNTGNNEQVYLVGQTEVQFCNDLEIDCSELYKTLDWNGWPGQRYFTKHATNLDPEPYEPNMCDWGCGRELREHERVCPGCSQHREEIFDRLNKSLG